MPEPLHSAAERFVADVSAALAELSGRSADYFRDEVAVEASALAAAVIMADGRATDDELWGWIGLSTDHLGGSLVHATPAQVRDAGLLLGRALDLGTPSNLMQLLVDADRQRSTRRAWVYYERSMALAHATGALDSATSSEELAAIDRLRATLLACLTNAGISRTGGPTPTTPSAPPGAQSPGNPASAGTSTAAPLAPARALDELLAELDGLIGLAEVKREVHQVADLLQVQRLRAKYDLPVIETTRHLVFTGNPGTGKTTVARLVAEIYRSLEVVSKGQLVECDREDLVAGFVGQTAIKTTEVVQGAVGGILLIDEAYALARGGDNDFGREAIDTLVKLMEDHRDDLVVIVAGYPTEMQTLLDTNPGLRSRFSRIIHFADYADDELVSIFASMGAKQRYVPDTAALDAVRSLLATQPRTQGFGNARLVRNIFEQSITRHASRVVSLAEPTPEVLSTLTADDIPPQLPHSAEVQR